MVRPSSPRRSARSMTLPALLSGALLLSACVSSLDGDIFKTERCTLGEETCGCRSDQTCDGALTCLSNLCVNASGGAPTTSSGGAGGSAAGSGGAPDRSDGGGVNASGSAGVDPGGGGDGNSGGASNEEGGGGPGEPSGNLVENGDFSEGESLWMIEPAQTNRSIVEGALCLTIQAGESLSLGWPSDASRAFELAAGQSYTFSYRASSSGPLAVTATAKIGHAVAPYKAHFEHAITIGASLEGDSHHLEVADDDDGAGVLFSIAGAQGKGTTTVCFDDVSVLQSP